MAQRTRTQPDDYEHVDQRQDRDISDLKAHYPIAVYQDGREYVATQDGANLEARGYSPAEAIANYANAVAMQNSGEQVIPDE